MNGQSWCATQTQLLESSVKWRQALREPVTPSLPWAVIQTPQLHSMLQNSVKRMAEKRYIALVSARYLQILILSTKVTNPEDSRKKYRSLGRRKIKNQRLNASMFILYMLQRLRQLFETAALPMQQKHSIIHLFHIFLHNKIKRKKNNLKKWKGKQELESSVMREREREERDPLQDWPHCQSQEPGFSFGKARKGGRKIRKCWQLTAWHKDLQRMGQLCSVSRYYC